MEGSNANTWLARRQPPHYSCKCFPLAKALRLLLGPGEKQKQKQKNTKPNQAILFAP